MCRHLHRQRKEATGQAGVEHVLWHSLKASAFLFVFEIVEKLIGECGFCSFYEFAGFYVLSCMW
jgi:hypothetical protein